MDISKLEVATNSKYINSISKGTTFGHWTVVDGVAYITKDKQQGSIYFLCVCNVCNINHRFVNIHALKKGKRGGCRTCISHIYSMPSGKDNPNWKGVGEISKSYILNLKKAAANRNIKFDVSMKYLWELFLSQERTCKLSGVPISFSSSYGARDGTASLDRIDRTNGYVKGNVQWVHKVVNEMKWDRTDEELIAWCKTISEHNKNVSKHICEQL